MKIEIEVNEDVVDIPAMRQMSAEEYRNYLEYKLFLIDHHDVLRSAVGEYPLAVTAEQIQILIEYLQRLESRIGGENA